MSASLILSSALSGAESLVNTMLSQDSAAQKKILAMSGKVLRIHCEKPSTTITIQVVEDRIFILQGNDLEPDSTISGKAYALMKLLMTRSTTSLHRDGITISGDTGVPGGLQEILQDLDIDWEYQLSNIIGDIPTQLIADGMAVAKNFIQTAGSNFQEDIAHYLVTEKKLFPEEPELESFYHDVDNLRLRLDRLAARIKNLEPANSP